MTETTFEDVLALVREGARTETQKGARFERLMTRALPLLDPDCARVVTRDQLTAEQAARLKIPSNDTGIDLIGFTADDPDGQESVIAIQCKCYDANTSVTKSDLDSFLVHGQKRTIKRLLWVDTSWRRFSPNLERHVATIDKWSRIDVETLGRRRIDWQAALEGAPRRDPLTPNAVQREAIDKVVDGLARHDRGQCLMACGTGKTLVAQRIAEALTPDGGRIIVFVPSRALLKQTLEAWQDNQTAGIGLCAVCSDTSVGNEIYSEDLRLEELDCPVTTRAEEIADAWRAHAALRVRSVTISTYQSSERISEAQAAAGDAGRFDLAIADEAHCTAGTGADEGPFRLVHYEPRIRARKRLYMTATPQIWSANVHKTAKKTERPNFSMDNEARFGPVLYDLPFAEAVRQKLICEITLVVQTTSSRDVLENRVNSDQMARLGIETDTATRMTGVYNAMHSRRALNGEQDDTPVKRAVFFSNRIRESKRLTADFNAITADIRSREPGLRPVSVRHIDGTMPMSHRAKEIAWLKENADETRVLSNAQCLTQGVDVPALDAVVFMKPKKSQLEMVQAVGRATRRPHGSGKQRGYAIVPMVIREGEDAEQALRDSPDWKTLIETITALRAHDSAFEIELQQLRYEQDTKGAGEPGGGETTADPPPPDDPPGGAPDPIQGTFDDELRKAIIAITVNTASSRRFWKNWGQSTANAYKDLRARIAHLYERKGEVRRIIDRLVSDLRDAAHGGIDLETTIAMLAQHQICRRIFVALFGAERDHREPPAAVTLQETMDLLEAHGVRDEVRGLEAIYSDVERNVRGLRSPRARQELIRSLYDQFFREAFADEVGRMGIAYTPVELIDYLGRAAERKIRKLSGGTRGLAAAGVHVMDPFAGTGTVLARLMSDLTLMPDAAALQEKFERGEFHANEIELLAYYVTCANVEQTIAARTGSRQPFRGAVLTNTFETAKRINPMLPYDADRIEANRRQRQKQREAPIRVMIGNPPWSVSRDPTESLGAIRKRIEETYAHASERMLKRNLYDKYVLALRWATDRLRDSPSDGSGVIAFVLNNGWLRGDAAQGIRRCMMNEFAEIEIIDLRGDARGRGEVRRAEGATVFEEASRAGVCLFVGTLDPSHAGPARVLYKAVGDGWTLDRKTAFLDTANGGADVEFEELPIDKNGDWLDRRKAEWERMIPLGRPESRSGKVRSDAVFTLYSLGVCTKDDRHIYADTAQVLRETMPERIGEYNTYARRRSAGTTTTKDASLVKWHRELTKDAERGNVHTYDDLHVRSAAYRPFINRHVYFARHWSALRYQVPNMLPAEHSENRLICVGGQGDDNDLSLWVTDRIPDLHVLGVNQVFPEYRFKDGRRHENVAQSTLDTVRGLYDDLTISNSDVFEFIYGRLHDPEYRRRFRNETRKDIPRITWPETAAGFRRWRTMGAELARLHLGWEDVEPFPLDEEAAQETLHDRHHYRPLRPRWLDSDERTRLRLNDRIILGGIPAEAHEWKLAGVSALHGLVLAMKRLEDQGRGQIEESGNDRYWVDTIGRVVTVALETIRIVDDRHSYTA